MAISDLIASLSLSTAPSSIIYPSFLYHPPPSMPSLSPLLLVGSLLEIIIYGDWRPPLSNSHVGFPFQYGLTNAWIRHGKFFWVFSFLFFLKSPSRKLNRDRFPRFVKSAPFTAWRVDTAQYIRHHQNSKWIIVVPFKSAGAQAKKKKKNWKFYTPNFQPQTYMAPNPKLLLDYSNHSGSFLAPVPITSRHQTSPNKINCHHYNLISTLSQTSSPYTYP